MKKVDLLAENERLVKLLRWALVELQAIEFKHPILESGIQEIEEALIEAGEKRGMANHIPGSRN